MKIVQFGLHYSPNVGDGIISETLGHAIETSRPRTTYQTVDISGRGGFGAVTVRNRALVLKGLAMLPRGARGRLVEARLGRMLDAVEADWRAALEGADLAIIGGGQIFSDADLNFCTKIARVADLLRDTAVPAAIHAAGVSGNWSARGTDLFGQVFDTDLRAVGLRDPLSVAHWVRQSGGRGPAPHLARDPGVLAGACYGPTAEQTGEIGLCITAPDILTYHSDSSVAGIGGRGRAAGLVFFAALAGELATRGHRVRLFCNGAQEDRAALAQVAGRDDIRALAAQGRVHVCPAPETPSDLAALIRPCGAVIAHRMHACIVAYGYRIPPIGLGWDRKLESFLNSVDAPDWFVGAAGATPAQVADVAGVALNAGVDPAIHGRVLAEAQAAVDDLLSAL